jgi:transcriptional regulator with XRE-family HTH domain
MDEAEDWRPRLRRARRDLHINLKDVAAATGLSYETLRGYENGRRRPTRDNLIRVLDAMDVPYIEANEILNDAGFAGRRTRFPEDEFPSYYFSRNELASAVETVGWPQFVVGNLMEVCAANTAAQALWGVDFEYEQRTRTRAQMTLLSVASDHHFADRLGNWDEVLRTMAGLFKGRPE